MKRLWILACIWLATPTAQADIYFEEEMVNPGFGKSKAGARTTVHSVYIKGKTQKVDARLIVDKKTEKALKDQGQPLRSSTILNLGKAEVFEIDLDAQTFVRTNVPPLKTGAAKTARQTTSALPPKVAFAFKVPGDSSVVAAIPCKRVVAQMRARYDAGKKSQRENRYTYDACVAEKFPGWSELRAFQALQDSTTSYPALIAGGMQQFSDKVQELDRLQDELRAMEAELNGFALRSTLTASAQQAGSKRWTEVFRLERQINILRHAPLPDSLFTVPKTLTQVKASK